MRSLRTCLVTAASALTLAIVLGAPASAAVISVSPGQSIQTAINSAQAGDIVSLAKGTYHEGLEISKPITLDGNGSTLVPPATAPSTLCAQFGSNVGVCVHGSVQPPSTPNGEPTLLAPVSSVRITQLRVSGFNGDGIFVYGGDHFRLDHSTLSRNNGYGIFANTSSYVRLDHNLASRNRAPGLYIGDSPKAHVLVTSNRSLNNLGEGILLRAARYGTVSNNSLSGNCAGVLVLGGAPKAAGNFAIRGNSATHNSRFCRGEADEGEPSISGIGIAILSAHDNLVTRNSVRRNHRSIRCPKSGALACLRSAGIEVLTLNPQFVSRRNLIYRNTSLLNSGYDLRWDKKGTRNRFLRNINLTASPSGLA